MASWDETKIIDKLQGKAKVRAIIGMDVIIFLVVMMLGVMVIKYL